MEGHLLGRKLLFQWYFLKETIYEILTVAFVTILLSILPGFWWTSFSSITKIAKVSFGCLEPINCS